MSGVTNGGNGQVLFGNFSARHYQSPTVLIYGSLTEYDRTLKNYKTGFDGSLDYLSTKTRQGILKQGTAEQQVFEDRNGDAGGLSGSDTNVENLSRMTMDFRVVKIDDANLIRSESVVTNTILLYQKAKDKSFGVSLNGKSLGILSTFGVSGAVGYANTMTDVDARHAAVRMLIERSVMEALGKTYNVPYWRCLAKEDVTKEVNPKDPDNEEYEAKFIVRPNDTVRLSKKAINMLTSVTNDYQYPDSMIDKDEPNSEADLNVINAVKRYFERDDYINKDKLITFFKRPTEKSVSNLYLISNEQRISEIQEKTADIAKKQQKIDEIKMFKTWISKWEKILPKDNSECGQYYFINDYDAPNSILGEDETEGNKKFNPDRYMQVDTKTCLFNRVLSVYGKKNAKDLYAKYQIYGNGTGEYSMTNPDFFSTLWLNIPIELNARWKY
jgi:hypothetical protein